MSDAGEKQTEVRIRRAPRYPAFILVGAAVGAIVTLMVTSLFPADPSVGFAALYGYFALFGIAGGAVLGAIIAIIVDRRSSRRAQSLAAVVERSNDD